MSSKPGDAYVPRGKLLRLVKRLVKPEHERRDKLDSDDAIVAVVNDRYENGKRRREPYVRDWVRNIHYYAGDQAMVFETVNGVVRYRPKKHPTYYSRVTENRILRLVQATVNLIVGGRPEYQCIPGPDQSDRTACELGERILASSWDHFHLEEYVEEAGLWLLNTGIVGMVTRWDPLAGPVAPLPLLDENGELVMDPETQQPLPEMRNGKLVYDHIGDVRHTLVSGNLFLPDDFAVRPRECKWYIYHPFRSLRYIEERWPDKVDDVIPETPLADPFDELHAGDYFGQSGWQQTMHESSRGGGEGATIVEMVQGPCQEFPKGAIFHVAGQVLLDVIEDLDEDCLTNQSLGMAMARCFVVPGRFWPTSLTDQLISPQNLLNETQEQVHHARALTCYPKILEPRGARLGQNAFTTKPGERIQYMPGYKPEQWEPPGIPRYVTVLAEQLPRIMQELAGTHQATLGQAPQNLRSGIAIAEVQEQDQIGWGMPTRELERLIEDIGRRELWLMQQNYNEERVMPLVGEDTGHAEMVKFQGANLKGVADVKVVKGTSTHRSKAQQRAWLLEILNTPLGQAILTSPVTVNRLFEAFDMGHITAFRDSWKLDRSAALRALVRIEETQGQDVPHLQAWDDPLMWMRVVGDDLKSAKTQGQLHRPDGSGAQDPVYQGKVALFTEIAALLVKRQMNLRAAQQPPQPEESAEQEGASVETEQAPA